LIPAPDAGPLHARPLPPLDPPEPPPAGTLSLWLLDLDAALRPGCLDAAHALLNEPERARAAACARPDTAGRFVATRGALRRLLGACLGIPPSAVPLATAPGGKPALAGGGPPAFNLAHSGRWALYAVAGAGAVGVDIEAMKPRAELAALARRYFSPDEQAALQAWPAAQQHRAFYTGWVQKEAYIKGLGDGLRKPLDRFTVALAPEAPGGLLADRDDPDAPARWRILPVAAPDGYAAALAWRPGLQETAPHGTMEPTTEDTR
jgi:4'-phosphopantetheinyl transferase